MSAEGVTIPASRIFPCEKGLGVSDVSIATRREFLQRSASTAALAGAALLPGGYVWGETRPETVRLGLIGCGSIMGHHLKGLVGRKEAVTIGWLCDVDPAQTDRLAGLMEGFQSAAPRRTQRFEDVLEDRSVDACIIATPHHWHAPMSVAALLAGKDVYIEKPISHVFDEGPLMIEAARKTGRIVQQGSQMRSSPVTAEAGRLLAEGVIGEVKVARAWTAEIRSLVKPVPDTAAPEGVDYDLWLGPAPKRPFNPLRFHQTWRMFRDYGNGEIGDDGIHDLDMATWGLGVTSLPVQVTARAGRMQFPEHASEYPDNMHVIYEYADGRTIVYENYPFTAYGLHGFDNGNVFYGTEGYMVFSRRGAFSTFLGPKNKPGPTESPGLRRQTGYAEHMADFLNAVRTRQPVKAPPEVAHRSCALVHLGDIAARTGGRIDLDPERETILENPAAVELLGKSYRAPFAPPTL